MSFRLVPKLVTLNDLERRNGRYFTLFHRIRVRWRRKKFTFAISSPDEFLVLADIVTTQNVYLASESFPVFFSTIVSSYQEMTQIRANRV